MRISFQCSSVLAALSLLPDPVPALQLTQSYDYFAGFDPSKVPSALTQAESTAEVTSEVTLMAETGFMDDLTKYANKAVSDLVPGMESLGKMLHGSAQ